MEVVLCSPMYALLAAYFLPCTGTGSTQEASPQLCIMHMFVLITSCTLFTPPFPQVFPDNARIGTFCSKLISQKCYQTAPKRVFSGVGSPQLCRESENHAVFILSSTQDCISSPVSSHQSDDLHNSGQFTKMPKLIVIQHMKELDVFLGQSSLYSFSQMAQDLTLFCWGE